MTTARVLVKTGAQFTTIAPAGFEILAALEATARTLGRDVMITSGCDGAHSGPYDPHHTGNAYDVRTQWLSVDEKIELLETVIAALRDPADPGDAVTSPSRWERTTRRFYAFLEDAGTPNEHIHVQLRIGAADRE